MVDPAGNETILYNFAGPPNDGAHPWAGVIRDEQGNLYGTTPDGGEEGSACRNFDYPGCGVVFELSPQ